MTPIEFFKLQAKNLFKDYKTKTKSSPEDFYEYSPKYFDMDSIVCDFDIDEDNFSLMNAQHIIACMVGFEKWTDLLKASKAELALAKLLFDNRIHIEDWNIYIAIVERDTKIDFDDESRLNLLEELLNTGGFANDLQHHRLDKKG